MTSYLKKLIARGENQQLDFKFCISDSRKISRTLSAFANSDGGRLLIGVRDNGSIAGIRSDEEIYMVETAAQIFCRPEVLFTARQITTDGKTVLEVVVPKGESRPYKVREDDGRWRAYFRHGAQNLVANRVLLQVWNKEMKNSGVLIKFGKAEISLMEYLGKNETITVSKFRKISHISSYKAESILANLILFKVLIMNASEKGFSYRINPDESKPSAQLHS